MKTVTPKNNKNMKPELQDLLLEYLGELKYEQEKKFDWIEKDSVSEKINSGNVLLGFDGREKTWYQKVADALNIK